MGSIIHRSECPCCGSAKIIKVLTCKDYTVSKKLFDIWECAGCTLRFTQDVPTQEAIGPYYQSDAYISHTDSEKGLVNKVYKIARNYTLTWKMKLVSHLTGIKKAGTLLDIGAGTGAFTHRVTTEKWQVTGLEPDPGARAICQEKYRITLQPSENLFQLPSKTFDAVTMWHVLEHVHQLQEYMIEIKRVLKDDGVAFIALPNYTSKDAKQYGEFWAAYDVPRHLYHFSPQSVKTLATRNGLQVNDTVPMWLDAYYIAMLSETYKTGKSALPNAVLSGFKSNLHAGKNKETCSSLVYIIRKAG